MGYSVNKLSLEDTIHYYLFSQRLLISGNSRLIHYSSEFLSNENIATNSDKKSLKIIKKTFESGNGGGVSINRFMSDKVITDPREDYDKTLMASHMHHLHLDMMSSGHNVKRSSELLFIWVTPS